MGRISVPNFPSVVNPGGLATPQMPGMGGDPAGTARLAGQAIEQSAALGRGMSQLGSAAMDIAMDMQREANRVQVINGQNLAQRAAQELTFGGSDEPGFQSFKGPGALADMEGVDLSSRYGTKLKERLDKISEGMGNDAQRAAFGVWRGNLEADFVGKVQAHQRQQFVAFSASTALGSIEIGTNNAAADWNDDDKVKQSIYGDLLPGSTTERYGGVRQAAYDLARVQGKSVEETSYDVRKATSRAHLGVITAALSNQDSRRAMQYLEDNKQDMLSTDVLTVNNQVSDFVAISQAQTSAAATTKEFANRFQPTDVDRFIGVIQSLESGGRDFNADGTPLVSKAGAKYAMQVMPATAKNPGHGIRPAADDSPAEYNRVGRQLADALLKKYANAGQALAAYNGGEGHVDKAIADAKAAGSSSAWVDGLRKYKSAAAFTENSNYVKNGLAKLETGGGAPEMPTAQEFVQAAIDKLGPNPSPKALKLTQQAAEQQFNLIDKSIKERGEKAKADAMRELQNNGGRVDLLPYELRSKVPPKELDKLYDYGRKLAKGDDHTSEWLYAKLAGNPARLAAMSDDQFFALRAELSEADFKHFANERAKAQGKSLSGGSSGGGGADKAGDLNSTAIKNTLDTRLRVLGINPSPTDDGGKDAARIGAIRQFADQYFYAAQREAGKKFTDAEVAAHVDALFAHNITFRGFFSDTSGPMLTMKSASDIPTTDRDGIRAAFKKGGVTDPTDAQMLGAYWGLQTTRRGQAAAQSPSAPSTPSAASHVAPASGRDSIPSSYQSRINQIPTDGYRPAPKNPEAWAQPALTTKDALAAFNAGFGKGRDTSQAKAQEAADAAVKYQKDQEQEARHAADRAAIAQSLLQVKGKQ